MELKKNPAKDIHRKSGMFFQIGLGISIALMITAFEWRTEVPKVQFRKIDNVGMEMMLIPVTEHKEPEPALPSPVKTEVVSPKIFTTISTETATRETPEQGEPTIDPETMSSGLIPFVPEGPEPCEECPFIVVEQPPMPIGGLAGLYAMVRKNLKYPRQARQMNVDGKVTVEFIVNRDGSAVDMNVISGIGAGCDEEAKRVIGLTKWNPGKQRGKPVRVKMVMPIIFKLN
jgi:protein TonB